MRVSKEKAVELATKRVEKVTLYFNRASNKLAEAQKKLWLVQDNLAASVIRTPKTTGVNETQAVEA